MFSAQESVHDVITQHPHFSHSKPPLTAADIARLEEIRKEFSLLQDKAVKSGPPPSDTGGHSEAQKVKKKAKYDPELRKIQSITCELKPELDKRMLSIRLLFDDCLRRSLTTELKEGDQAEHLAKDLVVNGLINESDCEEVCRKITERLSPQAVGSQAAPLPPSSAVQA